MIDPREINAEATHTQTATAVILKRDKTEKAIQLPSCGPSCHLLSRIELAIRWFDSHCFLKHLAEMTRVGIADSQRDLADIHQVAKEGATVSTRVSITKSEKLLPVCSLNSASSRR